LFRSFLPAGAQADTLIVFENVVDPTEPVFGFAIYSLVAQNVQLSFASSYLTTSVVQFDEVVAILTPHSILSAAEFFATSTSSVTLSNKSTLESSNVASINATLTATSGSSVIVNDGYFGGKVEVLGDATFNSQGTLQFSGSLFSNSSAYIRGYIINFENAGVFDVYGLTAVALVLHPGIAVNITSSLTADRYYPYQGATLQFNTGAATIAAIIGLGGASSLIFNQALVTLGPTGNTTANLTDIDVTVLGWGHFTVNNVQFGDLNTAESSDTALVVNSNVSFAKDLNFNGSITVGPAPTAQLTIAFHLNVTKSVSNQGSVIINGRLTTVEPYEQFSAINRTSVTTLFGELVVPGVTVYSGAFRTAGGHVASPFLIVEEGASLDVYLGSSILTVPQVTVFNGTFNVNDTAKLHITGDLTINETLVNVTISNKGASNSSSFIVTVDNNVTISKGRLHAIADPDASPTSPTTYYLVNASLPIAGSFEGESLTAAHGGSVALKSQSPHEIVFEFTPASKKGIPYWVWILVAVGGTVVVVVIAVVIRKQCSKRKDYDPLSR